MKLATLWLALAAPLAAHSPHPAPCAPSLAAEHRATESPKQAIARYMQTCEALGWSGVVVVRRKGRVLYESAHGLADRASGRVVELDTRFEIASMTKPITAAAVLTLVDAGTVDLDASIAEYLPNVPEHSQAITVAHLLAHRSGMPRSASGGSGADLGDAVAGYLKQRPSSTPGTTEGYWNGGYALLAGIVEVAGDMSFEEYVRTHVFEPAKMLSSGFTGGELKDEDLAVGYEAGKPDRLATDHPYRSAGWHYRGMGGVVTTAADVLRFIDALDRGAIIKKETAKLMETPVGRNYGMGFGMATTKNGDVRRGHGGDVRGFHSYVTSLQKGDIDVVVLANFGPFETYKLTWNLEALALGKKPPYAMPPALEEWKRKDLESLAGDWSGASGTLSLTTTPAGGFIGRLKGGAPEPVELEDPQAQFAVNFVRSIESGGIDEVRKHATDRFPSWPQRLINSIWPQHVEQYGPLLEILPFAVIAGRDGFVDVRFRLRHENESLNGLMTLSDEKVVVLVLDDRDWVFMGSKGYTDPWASASSLTWWMPTESERLVSYNWGSHKVSERMTLDGPPRKSKTLRLSGSTKGLFERVP